MCRKSENFRSFVLRHRYKNKHMKFKHIGINNVHGKRSLVQKLFNTNLSHEIFLTRNLQYVPLWLYCSADVYKMAGMGLYSNM